MNTEAEFPWSHWRRRATVVAMGCLVVWLLGALLWHVSAFRAYWFAWVFWGGLAFGCLVLCFLQFLTRGLWSLVLQRPLEAGIMTLPVMAVCFVPVLFAMRDVFPWAGTDLLAHAPHKKAYLTVPWFTVRTLLCFGLLLPMALRIRYWSDREDRTLMEPEPAAKLRALGAGGLVLYSACMLIASTDWVMSLEPKWYSTMFVVIYGIGQLLTALAGAIAFVILVPERTGYAALFSIKCLRDIGNLLMAFVIFWTYVSFGQFLIIWSGNLPREISWFLHRSSPGWQAVVGLLALLQFAVPFALLLSRATKSHPRRLAGVALLVFAMNVLNVFWMVAPSFGALDWKLLLLCVPAWLGLGGIWSATFLFYFQKRAALPRFALELQKEREVLHA